MTDLSRLPALRLIAASRAAPGSAARARYLVSGSVQRESGTLRINVRLIDTGSGQQLWSERYKRPYGDLFKLQDKLARKLTQVLPGKLTDAVRQSLAPALYAQPRGLRRFPARAGAVSRPAQRRQRGGPGLLQEGAGAGPELRACLRGAGDDLRHGVSTAADARARRPRSPGPPSWPKPRARWIRFRKCIGRSPSSMRSPRRHRQAIESLQKAIELNPSYADAYALMGGIYTYIGQPAKSIPLLRTAMRLNPDGGRLLLPAARAHVPVRGRRRAGADQSAPGVRTQSGRPRNAPLSGRGADCGRGSTGCAVGGRSDPNPRSGLQAAALARKLPADQRAGKRKPCKRLLALAGL